MARAAATALCSLLLVVMACRHAQAGSPTDALRDVLLEVNRLLDDPELRQRPPELRAAMRRVLLPSFDARETARLALGAEWLGRTPGERDEFAALLADHLERAVVLRVAAHAPMHRALAIRSMAESIEGGTATVVVAMTNRAGGEFPVEYRLIREGDRWAIYDVVIDGGSLVANYRTMFARVLRESSYADLVALLRTRTSDGPAASTRAAASRGRRSSSSRTISASSRGCASGRS